jgi:hypothetical protein
MAHLFNDVSTQSVINNIKSSIRLEGDSIAFTVNTGKGSGEQTVAVSDFLPVVEVLQSYVDSGVFGVREDASPVDTIRRTIAHDPETSTISFRLTNGKGAKPVKVSVDDFPKVVAFLRDCAAKIG